MLSLFPFHEPQIVVAPKFVILTTAPNESVSDIHNRMPLVLEKPQISDWIFDTGHALALLHGTPPMLKRTPVSKFPANLSVD